MSASILDGYVPEREAAEQVEKSVKTLARWRNGQTACRISGSAIRLLQCREFPGVDRRAGAPSEPAEGDLMGKIVPMRRRRPPDPAASAANGSGKTHGNEREDKGTSGTANRYSLKDSGASSVRVEVRPCGGSCFFAPFVVLPNGTEVRLAPHADNMPLMSSLNG
jgi:hypothetical protein